MNKRTIEIDLEVHKLLEMNRKSFEEQPCDILRRILTASHDFPVYQKPGSEQAQGRRSSTESFIANL